MKHTRSRKPVRKPVTRVPVKLIEARGRVVGLTQLKLEELSGVDRTRISKLEIKDNIGVNHETYEKLDGALRQVGALKANEKLVFGPAAEAEAQAS